MAKDDDIKTEDILDEDVGVGADENVVVDELAETSVDTSAEAETRSRGNFATSGRGGGRGRRGKDRDRGEREFVEKESLWKNLLSLTVLPRL